MQDINLKTELEKAQIEISQNAILTEAQRLLSVDAKKEASISERIYHSPLLTGVDSLIAELLDPSMIFNLEAIETICTKYRLRFLDSTLFKGEVPVEAIRKVKHIEAATGLQFTKFSIIAPAERFRLKDSTKDPILLAELPNGRFYYIYQWGQDMSWKEHLLKYPFRHMGTLAFTSVTIGALIALFVPAQFVDAKAEFFYRFFMFSMSSALIMTLAIIIGIMYSKDFSENVWNSKFLR